MRPGKTKTVVVTGASRGIGLAMGQAFHERGCNVVICGRMEKTILAAATKIGGPERVLARVCDIRQPAEISELWRAANDRFGAVDIWVQNAGLGVPATRVEDHDVKDVAAVIDTNLTGSFLAAREAISGFRRQDHGALFMMQGLGGKGPVLNGAALHGASKAGVGYLTRVLIKEAKQKPYMVGSLSPGIVVTELSTGSDPAKLPASTRAFIDKVADPPETVAPWLVDGMLKAKRNGIRINWLTTPKLLFRLVAAPLLNRRALTRNSGRKGHAKNTARK